ncbi:MAG: hypothetical protein MUC45_02495 [Actinomycetia bacterium]|jgi:hypothetical protein|nr:hypothetical protein [Actinomycetes bacterium]
MTSNKRITAAHARGRTPRRVLRSPAGVALALGAAGLTAAVLIPQGASAEDFVRASATSSSIDRTLQDPAIVESSGLARSAFGSGRLWTHNDSGGGSTIYGVDSAGRTAARFNLGNASHKDWEAMAHSKQGSVNYLYIGDIGDNGKKRTSIFVHRVKEPALSAASGVLTPETYEFKYADGKHNAEGMMIHPTTHRLYIVTKATSGAGIYAAPTTLSRTSVNVLRRVASAPPGMSDAVFLDDGRFVLRGYVSGWLYRSFGATPTRFPLPLKGESVTTGFSTGTIFIGSEKPNSKVYRVALP